MQVDVEKSINNVAFQFNKMADLLQKISFELEDRNNTIVEFNTILGELWNADIISGSFLKENKIDFDYGRKN